MAYDIAWVAGSRFARRHDQRLHRELPRRARRQGRVGSARLLREREKTESLQQLAEAAPWFEVRMPWDPQVAAIGRRRRHRARDRRRRRDRRGGADDGDRHQPAERSAHSRGVRQQVRVAREHQRGVRQVAAAGVSARVLLVGRRGRARGEVGRGGERGDDRDSRGAGSRIGPRRRASGGPAAARAEGAVLGARGSARRSGGAVLRARAEDRRGRPAAGRAPGRRSCWPSTRRTRGTRSCSFGACARARRSKKTTCAIAR